MVKFIRGMDSKSCVEIMKKICKRLKYRYSFVIFNKINFKENHTIEQLVILEKELQKFDMSIDIDVKDVKIINACKLISEMFEIVKEKPEGGYSKHIANVLKCNDRDLQKLFKDEMHYTMTRYIIIFKTNKAIELILKKVLSMKEISNLLQYSNVSYFSRQFKKETGQYPGHYHV